MDNFNINNQSYYIMARLSKRVRDAETGRFLPEEEATRRPENTETEKLKVGQTKRRK